MIETARGFRTAEVDAQAKVNLRLRILAREASGYHQLETLFLRLTLADTVRVRRTSGTRALDVAGLSPGTSLGPMERNLAWRAAESYLAASGDEGGFAIELEKRIPVGGGLGGGSADAGAVLRALERLAPRPLGSDALLRIAAALGADVPFLASEHAYALAWGRGERLLPLAPPAARPVLLVVPPFAVNTADAYGWLAASHARAGLPPAATTLDLAALSDWRGLTQLAANDFEVVVAARHPEIITIVAWLHGMGALPAMLSGSGSVVFGVMPERVGLASGSAFGAAPMGRVIIAQSAARVEPVRLLD